MNLKNLNRSTKSNIITFGIVIGFYLLIQILSAAGMVTNSFAGQLVPICAYVVMAVSLNLTVGMLGELSLGHAGFMSVGAFAGTLVWVSLYDTTFPKPAALLLGYPINDFFEVKPLYQLAIDPLVLGWRYYWTDISDVVNENFTPTYFFYGKNDLYMQRMCYSQQGPLLERKLRESGAVYECHVYEDAPHAIGPGRHTDADGWIRQATAFWEKQCK